MTGTGQRVGAAFVPPPLGVGMVYFAALEAFYADSSDLLDVLEIEPQTIWRSGSPAHQVDAAALARIQGWPQHKLVHGVGMPLAATVPPDARQFAPWRESIDALRPAWASEHLAFQSIPVGEGRGVHSGFLLPALQCEASVTQAAHNIEALRRLSGVPIAFENSPNYLRRQKGEMPDGEFYARVAEQADCGILLDLHNLWCNQQNGRQSMAEAMRSLPLDRVWEIHLAGGEWRDGFWLDAHSDLVPPQVMEFCEEWLPRLPRLGAILFEIMPDYVQARNLPWERLAGQLEAMQALWRKRVAAAQAPDDQRNHQPHQPHQLHEGRASAASSPADWERALGALVNGRIDPLSQADAPAGLAQDPGVAVLQTLVESFRAGTLAEGLTLTYRLLVLTLGEAATQRLMAEFWRAHWPQAFASDELQAFAAFMRGRCQDSSWPVPHLRQVLDYEMSQIRALRTGQAEWVRFDCDPLALLGALARGSLPGDALRQGAFEMQVTPGDPQSAPPG